MYILYSVITVDVTLDWTRSRFPCDILTLSHSSEWIVFSSWGWRRIQQPYISLKIKKENCGFRQLHRPFFCSQSCSVHRDREMLNSVRSSLSSNSSSLDSDDWLYTFNSNEARRLYWAGRLRVSIDLPTAQSQLDLVAGPPPAPYPSTTLRSKSLYNISMHPMHRVEPKEEEQHRSFSVGHTKVINEPNLLRIYKAIYVWCNFDGPFRLN